MATSQGDADKLAWIDEHLPYELLMLKHAYLRITQPQDQKDWNAFFVAYCVHARNLYNLLTNKDEGNFKARDFAKSHKQPNIDKVRGPMPSSRPFP